MASDPIADAIAQVHRKMHPDPDELTKKQHLEAGDTIAFEDESNVIYDPGPNREEIFKAASLQVNFDTEYVYETRVYHLVPMGDLTMGPHTLKILAKGRKSDNLIWWTAKFERPDGTTFIRFNCKDWNTVAEFRAHVKYQEDTLRQISIVPTPSVVTRAEYERKQRKLDRLRRKQGAVE